MDSCQLLTVREHDSLAQKGSRLDAETYLMVLPSAPRLLLVAMDIARSSDLGNGGKRVWLRVVEGSQTPNGTAVLGAGEGSCQHWGVGQLLATTIHET